MFTLIRQCLSIKAVSVYFSDHQAVKFKLRSLLETMYFLILQDLRIFLQAISFALVRSKCLF